MSAQHIVPFLFEGERLLRVLDRAGLPWFVAGDVCRAIGLGNPAMAVKALDDDEKGISSIDTPGGLQEVIVVTEGGLYTLILRSRDATKPGTVPHRFRRWVTGQVLPALRQTGEYRMADDPGPAANEDPTLLPLLAKLRIVREYRQTWGIRVAQRIGMKLRVLMVSGMEEAALQPDLYDEEEAA